MRLWTWTSCVSPVLSFIVCKVDSSKPCSEIIGLYRMVLGCLWDCLCQCPQILLPATCHASPSRLSSQGQLFYTHFWPLASPGIYLWNCHVLAPSPGSLAVGFCLLPNSRYTLRNARWVKCSLQRPRDLAIPWCALSVGDQLSPAALPLDLPHDAETGASGQPYGKFPSFMSGPTSFADCTWPTGQPLISCCYLRN